MGYYGLESVGSSDMASDLAYDVHEAINHVLCKGLKEKGNQFNTDGPINVALYFESFLVPAREEFADVDCLMTLASKTMYLLDAKIKGWQGDKSRPNDANKKYHIKCVKRMIKSLGKFLDG